MHCVTDRRAMRYLLKDKFETDVEKKTQGQQVKPRDKQEIPEERGEEYEGELTE